jgi:sec-independent protein translocase protein TatA
MGLDNPIHLAFIVVVLLLVFGARRLPEIGRSLGSGMREFKDSLTGEAKPTTTLTAAQQPAPPVAPPAPPVAQPAPSPVAATPPVAAPAPAEPVDESTFGR